MRRLCVPLAIALGFTGCSKQRPTDGQAHTRLVRWYQDTLLSDETVRARRDSLGDEGVLYLFAQAAHDNAREVDRQSRMRDSIEALQEYFVDLIQCMEPRYGSRRSLAFCQDQWRRDHRQ